MSKVICRRMNIKLVNSSWDIIYNKASIDFRVGGEFSIVQGYSCCDIEWSIIIEFEAAFNVGGRLCPTMRKTMGAFVNEMEEVKRRTMLAYFVALKSLKTSPGGLSILTSSPRRKRGRKL